ncbi:hypothetical protein HDU91_001248 [Kappamyces sp. JEL0680]|nr:hypothetical protein HDU91_001248 [Kappamyces sp. JEL0680]
MFKTLKIVTKNYRFFNSKSKERIYDYLPLPRATSESIAGSISNLLSHKTLVQLSPEEYSVLIPSLVRAAHHRGLDCGALLEGTSVAITYRNLLEKFSPGQLANLLHAFALARYLDRNLFADANAVILSQAAVSKLPPSSHSLPDNAALSRSEGGLAAYSPGDFAKICWAFASQGLYQEKLLTAILDQIASNQRFHEFSADEIAQLSWSYAHVGAVELTGRLVTGFLPQIESLLAKDQTSRDSTPLHSGGTLAISPSGAMAASDAVETTEPDAALHDRQGNGIHIDDFSRILWSMAVGNVAIPKTLADALCDKAVDLYRGDESVTHLSHLYLWWLHLTTYMTYHGPNLVWVQVLMKSRGAIQVCLACSSNVHKLAAQIGKFLQQKYQPNHICMATGFHLDFVDLQDRVVLDCLGSTHYVLKDGQFSLGGESILKKRLLSKLAGWRVVIIPYYKWIRKQKLEREAFLKREIGKQLDQL